MPVVKYKDSRGQIKKVPLVLPLDDALSSSSTNGVQNRVIKEALDSKGTYSAPSSGIPKTDLAIGVQTSLEKADNALQASALNPYRTSSAQDTIDNNQNTAINAKYTKPSTGIPASDLAPGVIPETSEADGMDVVESIGVGSTDEEIPTAKAVYDAVSGKENKGKITISGIEKTANTHTVTIVTNGETTNLILVGVS